MENVLEWAVILYFFLGFVLADGEASVMVDWAVPILGF
jgi:hypothetical protein